MKSQGQTRLDALITGRVATFAGEAGFAWVDAVGICAGRVVSTGSILDLEPRTDSRTRRIDLEPGEVAIPGLIDAHLHLGDAALAAERVDLTGARSIDEGLAAIAEYAATVGPQEWLEGGGWDPRRWGRWPTAADLERAVPGRAAAFWSFDHHALWVSPAAMAAARIDASTPNPDGGVITRLADGGAGAPAGVLLENATQLVESVVPNPSEEKLERTIKALSRALLSFGVVGIHDPGMLGSDSELRVMKIVGALADRGQLPVRVHTGIGAAALAKGLDLGLRSGARLGEAPRQTPDRARVGWLKLFADGTLSSRTAALLDPIGGAAPDPAVGERGVFKTSPETLSSLAARAAAGGIATQIHAIGDHAVAASLDALAPTSSRVPLMPRIEHAQLCQPEDRERFASEGIAASVQPVHLRDDAATARRDWGDRAETLGYAYRSLLTRQAVLAFGTDAPVEPIDPWPGIAMAVLRHWPAWPSEEAPFGPAEALTLDEALRASTVGPATTALEPLRGRLVPGAPADLLVLTAPLADPREAAHALAAIKPRLVLVDGEIAFER